MRREERVEFPKTNLRSLGGSAQAPSLFPPIIPYFFVRFKCRLRGTARGGGREQNFSLIFGFSVEIPALFMLYCIM
jgi:hypothetical protein